MMKLRTDMRMSPRSIGNDTGFLYNTATGKALEKKVSTLISVVSDRAFDAARVAAEFVSARRSAGSFSSYPGAPPADLAEAYRCQDEAIALWNDSIAGWKVGWIAEPHSTTYGAQRLVGPIFRKAVLRAQPGATCDVPVFARGFAAVEAEFVFQLCKDTPSNVAEWTAETARRFVRTMYVGVEIASSPLQNINDFGPAVVASDFGNNAGLLIGTEVPDWEARPPDTMHCETRIDGEVVGQGTAAAVSGGPLAALAFALRCNSLRDRPLRAGDFVSTGAATGVHSIGVGQIAEAIFTGIGTLKCRTVAMPPAT
jgi:2-keto-4-pentenoate hydratase